MTPRPLTAVVASDGSAAARAAVSLAMRLPWADRTRAFGVVALAATPAIGIGRFYRDALVKAYRAEAERLTKLLRTRFEAAQVTTTGTQPVAAILAEQRKRRAQVIVVGCRGLGLLGRFPLGSVSRQVIREAPCAVIVAKRPVRHVWRMAIAVDGSAASARAVRFVERLKAPPAGRVRLVGVVPPLPVPRSGRLPATIRAAVTRDVAAARQKREGALRRHLSRAADRLRRSGWTVIVDLRRGTPVVEILKAAADARADILACGAARRRGLTRRLLGSVADGLVSRAPMAVLVVK